MGGRTVPGVLGLAPFLIPYPRSSSDYVCTCDEMTILKRVSMPFFHTANIGLRRKRRRLFLQSQLLGRLTECFF